VRRAAAALGLLLASLAACGEASSPAPDAGGPAASSDIPPPLQECARCHARQVREFMGHGMSHSLGPLGEPPTGAWTNPATLTHYVYGADAQGPSMTATRADGGRRVQRLVGRIGAGIFDTSFVGTELDPLGRPTGRLFFLPLEKLADGQLVPAPFEEQAGTGFDQPVTPECLECHTTGDPRTLVPKRTLADRVYPGNALGADALARLGPLTCDACHGDTQRHADIEGGRATAPAEDIGVARLGELGAGAQRDVCARCHLDGEARVELHPLVGYGPRRHPLHQDRPVLVPALPDDDFRFVAQLDRLVLSACFRGSPDMTCTTCHAPHRAVAAQGPASFEAACLRCHAAADCTRPPELTVIEVTGAESRTAQGCVDCHVRRSQPYDLAGVRTTDHWIRSRIARPSTAPPRAQHGGPLALFDDGRLAVALDSDGGRAWASGLVALGLWRRGDVKQAAELLDQLPPPGTPATEWPAPPAPLTPLPLSGSFHFVRGLVLEAQGRIGDAVKAYGDAAQADHGAPEPLVNRGALRLTYGDSASARKDADWILSRYPRSEAAFNLGARAMARDGNLEAAADALVQSTLCWPSDAGVWHELGRLYLTLGQADLAHAAFTQAAALEPSRPGLQADLAAAGH